MSMLAGLRAATPVDLEENPWDVLRRTMPLLVPGFELTKLDVVNDGRIGLRARSPLSGDGRYYVVMVMDGVDKTLADGTRAVLAGISKYRDSADAMVYDSPFRAELDPQPGAVAAWLAGLLLTEQPTSAIQMR